MPPVPMPRLYIAVQVTADAAGALVGERVAGPLALRPLLAWCAGAAPAFPIRMSVVGRPPFLLLDELRDLEPGACWRS